MKPHLSPSQGRVVRALASYLSNECKHSVLPGPITVPFVIESIESRPWSSLTFAGEHHQLVVRVVRSRRPPASIRAEDLIVSGHIVAIVGERWSADRAGGVMTLNLLTIADSQDAQPYALTSRAR